MRPSVLERGHRLRARMFIRLVRLLSRQRIDAVAQMALYRPQFFNRLANAFDFSWDSDQHVRVGAQVIHRISYRLPRILMR